MNKIYISFIEECIQNPEYLSYMGGRIEVHHPQDKGYHSEEIRFFTKKRGEFNRLRAKWDMGEVSLKQLETLKKLVGSKFHTKI